MIRPPLKVAIYDHKNEIITSEPFSSMRIHVVPVQGDFDNDHKGQWTEEYFRSKIVSGRPGKEPLLFGDLYIRLQDGVGFLDTIKFQDNSSFVASKRFKLGVMAADERISQRIQEGITESFAVKDIRGYSSKKNPYPSPLDPVHKLTRIAKDGDRHKSLEQNGIKTVEEFVLSYNRSHEDLRKILGKISDQDWGMIIDHALKCNPSPGNHDHQISSRRDGSYYIQGSSSIQPTSSAPQKYDYAQVNQQSSSPYTELSSGVSLEDAQRLGEQMGSQVDQDQVSGAGNEFLSVSQYAHSSGYDDITFDEEMDALFGVPVIEDPGWPGGGYLSAFEQSGGCTPASGARTPASDAGSCGNFMPYSRSPVTGARGQGCPGLSSSPAGGAASSSSYWTLPAPPISGADNINNAGAYFTDEE